jgi:predicted transposase YbfD/YdcC
LRPCLFRHLDGAALAATLARWFGAQATPATPAGTTTGVAIDGKAQRGRLRYAHDGCPVHALSAFCHEQGIVLAHEPIVAGADQAEAELTVAPALVARLDWHGRVLTGDALVCQRTLCRQVRAAGGDYLLLVKANQERLHDDIALLFDPPPTVPGAPLTVRRVAHTVENGHGRRRERRVLVASTDLTAFLDWPGVQQVFRVERTWREQGQAKRTVRYGITSLAPHQADAAGLLKLRRGHWSIENQLHRHKDVNFGEDASVIYAGQGPTVMAVLRDAARSLLHRAGIRRIAAQLRTHSQQPERALALVGPLPTGA